MSIEIRTALPGEAEAGARVHVACWQTSYRGLIDQAALDAIELPKWTERRLEAWSDPTRLCLVATTKKAGIIGFCEGGKARDPRFAGMGEVYALFVQPHGQGGGVGAALWRSMREAMRGRGYTRIMVKTLATNPTSRGFYERQGGRLSDLSSTFEFGGKSYPEVAYVYE